MPPRLLLDGCNDGPAIDRKVAAETTVAFALWKSRAMKALTPEQAKDFETAVQEVKFKIMSDGTATGSVAIDTAMRREIDGRRISEVIRTGLRAKISRLEVDRVALAEALKHNRQMRTRPGDTDSADHLRAAVEADQRRLDAAERDIAVAEERLKAATEASPFLRENPTPFDRLPDQSVPSTRPAHEA